MDTSDDTSGDDSLFPASRLNVTQKRKFKAALTEEVKGSGGEIFPLRAKTLVGETLGLDVSLALVEKLLTEFGYRPSERQQPYYDAHGVAQSAPLWKFQPAKRPLTPLQRTQALSERLSALSESFSEDVLGDELLQFASMEEIAEEAARSFALALAAAVRARARVGYKTILPRCSTAAQMAFASAVAA